MTDGVKIANTTACDMEGLTAEVKVYNLDGKSVEAYTKSAIVNSPSNSTVQCFTIDFNKERKNLSLNKPTFASSTTYGQPSDATDGKKILVGQRQKRKMNGFMWIWAVCNP